MEVIGGMPEIDDRKRLSKPVGDDVPDPFRAVGNDDQCGDGSGTEFLAGGSGSGWWSALFLMVALLLDPESRTMRSVLDREGIAGWRGGLG